MILRLLTALALLTAAASAQTKTVNKTISTNGLTENLTVPSGKTLTIASGATITAAEGSTITGFTASAAWGGITGTLSSQTDLQTALDAKANASALSSYLTTSTAASTYQPLDGDLTAIAALTTTSYGRELLTRADAAAVRSALSLGTLATQTATITDYLTISSAALTYQPLATPLTTFANLSNASGVLTNNGSGTLSYTATSTGGNLLSDSGKLARFGSFGELNATLVFQVYGPGGPGSTPNTAMSDNAITFTESASNFTSLSAATMTGGKYLRLPAVGSEASPATLISNADTGTVTNAMLAGSIALSKLAITGTPDGTKFLRDDGSWQTVTSGATLGANTFTGLQQFSGTNHAGLQLNNLTTTQRDALTGSAGMVIWNTTDGRMQLHNGTAWTSGMVRLAGDTMTGTLTLPAGTVSAPALTFGDSTTGIYRSASNEVAITNSGTQRFRTTTSGAVVTGTLNLDTQNLYFGAAGSSYGVRSDASTFTALVANGAAVIGGNNSHGAVSVISSWGLGFSSAINTTAPDCVVFRDAADAWAHRRTTNAQTWRLYNTFTSSTNFERFSIGWSSNVCTLKPEKGSSGSSRNAVYHTTETGVNWSSGSGSPEGVLTAPVGSLYTRTDGGASTTLYVKESGTGNTGWIAK